MMNSQVVKKTKNSETTMNNCSNQSQKHNTTSTILVTTSFTYYSSDVKRCNRSLRQHYPESTLIGGGYMQVYYLSIAKNTVILMKYSREQ